MGKILIIIFRFTTTNCAPTDPIINETASDQETTVLDDPIQYNIAFLFKNPTSHSSILTLDVTLDDDSSLPSWISFSDITYIITIQANSIQAATVKVTATNEDFESLSQTFEVAITNNAPTVTSSMGSENLYENVTFTKTVNLTTTFSETDPNQVIDDYVIVEWVSFGTWGITGEILTITGTPSFSDIGGVFNVQITASDGFDSALDVLSIDVIENEAPSVPSSYNNEITVYEGVDETTYIPEFDDSENDALSYSMTFYSGNPINVSWMTFNPLTRALWYIPPANQNSPLTLRVYASDSYNPTTETTLKMIIKFKPKDNPSIVDRTGEFVWTSFSSFEISRNILTDEDHLTDFTITLSDGSPVPSWLSVSYPNETTSGDFQFSGTYPTIDETLYEFIITATDSDSMSGDASFYIQTKSKIWIYLYCLVHCHSSWDTWDGPSIDNCLSWYSGRFLYLSIWQLEWPDGYYGDISENTWKGKS